MRSNTALRQSDHQPAADAGISQKMDGFARALTELGREHGIGVEGAILYAMEQEDYAFSYSVDDESRLIRA